MPHSLGHALSQPPRSLSLKVEFRLRYWLPLHDMARIVTLNCIGIADLKITRPSVDGLAAVEFRTHFGAGAEQHSCAMAYCTCDIIGGWTRRAEQLGEGGCRNQKRRETKFRSVMKLSTSQDFRFHARRVRHCYAHCHHEMLRKISALHGYTSLNCGVSTHATTAQPCDITCPESRHYV